MSEGIITGTIYETRLRDKKCCLRYGKKKKKYEMHHVIVLLWFPEIITNTAKHQTHQRVFKLQLAPEANYFHTTSVISRG